MEKAPKETQEKPANKDAPQRVFVNVPVPAAVAFDDRGRPTQYFPTNAVYTSKYTLLTFLPKNLFEQFRRVANLYFLGLTVLQFFPKYSTINPFVSALPLVVIVSLTAVKDGFEDWRRHKSDAEMNATVTWCVRGDAWRNSNEPFFRPRPPVYAPWALKREKRGGKSPGKVSPSGPSLENFASIETRIGAETTAVGGESSTMSRPATQQHWEAAILSAGTSTLAWAVTPWAEVVTGDLVLLKDNAPVPADVVILATSEPDALCYVETKNLDGETNLKIRQGVQATSAVLAPDHLDLIRAFKCVVECEKPNNSLYTFTGTLVLPPLPDGTSGKPQPPRQVPLSAQNVLLRGCYLRNTAWAIGLTVQTGASTKIRQNAGQTPMKRSRTEGGMNIQVLVNLGVLFAVCIVTCIANPLWERRRGERGPIWLDWTYQGIQSFASAAMDAFWNSIIIYQNVVPLSLYITLEIVKTMQAYFIYEDAEMYYPPSHRCIPRSWGIADDLGQIQYVFSDKTGTLTRNIMEFKKFSVAGVIYGAGLVDNDESKTLKRVSSLPAKANFDDAGMRVVDAGTRPPFWDDLLEAHLSARDTGQHASLCEFFIALAICHSVLVTPTNDPDDPPVYKASSPDEAALVNAARAAGFEFLSRESTAINVSTPDGTRLRYELLNVLEFNSTRKRMSVVVRTPENWIAVICKGADSVIWERLGEGQEILRDVTGTHLEHFADEGLRTLCIARAYITEEEYAEWAVDYQAASVALTDREDRMDQAAEVIERDLVLLGATAIEDKLQDGVPECIATLMSAGLKVWVLTGDKMETAINIGFSCNLLTRDMRLILVRGDDASTTSTESGPMAQISRALEDFFPTTFGGRNSIVTSEPPDRPSPCALIIDGAALSAALATPTARALLLRLATLCASVICCRVSPLQKAQIVLLVKHSQNSMTLAIGDGANDVSMIQAAHVGVGIAGEEGLQAAMASDYAIAQFRFLSRLLLIHGRWSYRRTSDMILCFFFKNIIWVMVLFWYQFWCGFSSTSLYDFTYTLLYNVVFTALPVITLGVFDQDLSEKYVVMVPPAYGSAVPWIFSYWRFAGYMLDAAAQSVFVIVIVVLTFEDAAAWPGGYSSAGRAPDLALVGSTAAIIAVLNANAVLIVSTSSFTWIHWLAYGISEAIVVLWTIVYSFFPGTTLPGVIIELASCPGFWLSLILASTMCQLPRLVVKYGWRTLKPTDTEIVQEIQKFGLDDLLDQREKEAAAYRRRFSEPPAAVPPAPSAADDKDARMEMGGDGGEGYQKGSKGDSSTHDEEPAKERPPVLTSMHATTVIESIPMLEPNLSKPAAVSGATSGSSSIHGPEAPPAPSARLDSPSVTSTIPVRRGGHSRSASASSRPPVLPPLNLTARLSIRCIPTPSELATPSSVTSPSAAYSTASLSRRTASALQHTYTSAQNIRQSSVDLTTSHFSLMRTGETTKNRGFSFAQDKGAADVLASHHSSLDCSSASVPHTPTTPAPASGAGTPSFSRPGTATQELTRVQREYGAMLSSSPASAAGDNNSRTGSPALAGPPRMAAPPTSRRPGSPWTQSTRAMDNGEDSRNVSLPAKPTSADEAV
ncbi:hypothetical protein HDU86_004337 [Geranomyces michiganensis]|nr:hypothetical protein HDU86_004337 [Geranomyces michiganensis]